jgi:hypothetical protein
MALKKIIDIGETFPVKKPRLGAAPPLDDVLDNIAAAQAVPGPVIAPPSARVPVQVPVQSDTTAKAPAKPPRPAKVNDGRGIHRGIGTDLRHNTTTGRTYQFGVRTTPEFAETIKQMAAERRMTLGEVLEEMLEVYRRARG